MHFNQFLEKYMLECMPDGSVSVDRLGNISFKTGLGEASITVSDLLRIRESEVPALVFEKLKPVCPMMSEDQLIKDWTALTRRKVVYKKDWDYWVDNGENDG